MRLRFPVLGVILVHGGVKLTDYVRRDGRKQVFKDWPQTLGLKVSRAAPPCERSRVAFLMSLFLLFLYPSHPCQGHRSSKMSFSAPVVACRDAEALQERSSRPRTAWMPILKEVAVCA